MEIGKKKVNGLYKRNNIKNGYFHLENTHFLYHVNV